MWLGVKNGPLGLCMSPSVNSSKPLLLKSSEQLLQIFENGLPFNLLLNLFFRRVTDKKLSTVKKWWIK